MTPLNDNMANISRPVNDPDALFSSRRIVAAASSSELRHKAGRDIRQWIADDYV